MLGVGHGPHCPSEVGGLALVQRKRRHTGLESPGLALPEARSRATLRLSPAGALTWRPTLCHLDFSGTIRMIGKPPTGPAAIPGSRGCWRALRGPKNPVPGCALGPGGVGVTRQEARRLCGGDRRGAHLLVPPGGKLQGVSEGRGARGCLSLSDSPCALLESLRECQFNSEGSLSLQPPATC